MINCWKSASVDFAYNNLPYSRLMRKYFQGYIRVWHQINLSFCTVNNFFIRCVSVISCISHSKINIVVVRVYAFHGSLLKILRIYIYIYFFFAHCRGSECQIYINDLFIIVKQQSAHNVSHNKSIGSVFFLQYCILCQQVTIIIFHCSGIRMSLGVESFT